MPKTRKTRAQRRAERRAKVNRGERIKPTPETLAKLRPWPMQQLLIAGPDQGGIDANEFEAALQIVEAFRVLVADIDLRSQLIECERVNQLNYDFRSTGMSERDAERCAIWFEWSARLPAGLPPRLVAWIEDETPIGSVAVLRHGCRLWERSRNEHHQRRQALDKTMPDMVTIAAPEMGQLGTIDGNPPNLSVQSFSPRAAVLPQSRAATLSHAHACSSSHADQTSRASPSGFRR